MPPKATERLKQIKGESIYFKIKASNKDSFNCIQDEEMSLRFPRNYLTATNQIHFQYKKNYFLKN